MQDNYHAQQCQSNALINCALDILQSNGPCAEEQAWKTATLDPLLNADATKAAWLIWARKTITNREATERAYNKAR